MIEVEEIMVSVYQIRRITSILLFIASIVVFLTGVILYLETTKILYKYVTIPYARLIHTYTSFIVSGIALIHIYLNWNILKKYFKS